MNTLSEALNEYVAMRRNLRFVFRLPASLLRTFVAFVDQVRIPAHHERPFRSNVNTDSARC